MLVPERRRLVLEHVRRHGSAHVGELAANLEVSAWTVRRDLDELEHAGHVIRTHGGAIARGQGRSDDADVAPVSEPKRHIAARAAELLADDETVMLLGGSTTQALVPHLRDRRMTVVTNGLDIAAAFASAPDVTLVMLGGYLHRDQNTLIGPMTEAAMAGLHVDVMVAGAWGVDAEAGVTGAKIIQAGQHRRMLTHAGRLMVLADADKLGRRGPTLLAGIDDVHMLITDSRAEPEVLTRLRAGGPEVVVATS